MSTSKLHGYENQGGLSRSKQPIHRIPSQENAFMRKQRDTTDSWNNFKLCAFRDNDERRFFAALGGVAEKEGQRPVLEAAVGRPWRGGEPRGPQQALPGVLGHVNGVVHISIFSVFHYSPPRKQLLYKIRTRLVCQNNFLAILTKTGFFSGEGYIPTNMFSSESIKNLKLLIVNSLFPPVPPRIII